eukprot:3941532-Rhodomonas_salina.1
MHHTLSQYHRTLRYLSTAASCSISVPHTALADRAIRYASTGHAQHARRQIAPHAMLLGSHASVTCRQHHTLCEYRTSCSARVG